MEENKVRKPVYKRWWFWFIMALATLTVIGVVVGIIAGGDDNSPSDSPGTQITSPSEYCIGDTVKSGSIEFTVISVSDTKKLGIQTTENNYVSIVIRIKNTGNSETNVYSSAFELKKGSSRYEITTDTIYIDNGFYIYEKLGSGITKTVIIAFETPTQNSDSPYTLIVKGVSYSPKEIVLKNK